ncbi:PSP1 C-terminal conserved region-domain-containing protein [Coemansia spiralis]|nr:PSP1 C-terminal conserved region-domain-containing protein [Coemansia spiralis]
MFASAPSTSNASAKDVLIKRIFRVADQREVADLASNKMLDEQNALMMCQSKVQQRKLSMCVVDAEFQFDRRKLTFYFTADQRVDFRELVRELFKHFKTRIWMCRLTN